MSLLTLMGKIETPEARDAWDETKKQKEREERLAGVISSKQIIPAERLVEILKEETIDYAKEKEFKKLTTDGPFEVYHKDENILTIHSTKPEQYLFIRASPEVKISKKKLTRAVLGTYFPKYNLTSEDIGWGYALSGVCCALGAGAVVLGATISFPLFLTVFCGGGFGSMGMVCAGAVLDETHRGSIAKRRFPKIEDYLQIYQGTEAIQKLEEL